MRAARATEDPGTMTSGARETAWIKEAAAVIRANPDLNDREVANAVRLRVRARMATLAEKSAAARRARAGLSARGLLDSGSDGVDLDS